MKKYLIIFLSLFSFIPLINAEELPTYYDKEIIEVDTLPEASEDTLNKVYLIGKNYYVTNKIVGNYTPVPLNEDLKGKTIYVKDLTDYFTNKIIYNTVSYLNYAKTSPGASYLRNENTIFNPCGFKETTALYGNYDYVAYKISDGNIIQRDTITYTSSCVINSWVKTTFSGHDIDISSYFSLTPFETTYSWQEVSKDQVIEYKVPTDDFYFFYTFEDITKFNILSSYDFTSFNDFQKLVIVLGFNTFFLVLIGFIVYILIKLINKGISILLD